MKKTFLLLSSGLAATCLLTSVHAETTAVQVSAAYAREVPPGQANSAAYMVLHNAGTEEESLVGAETPVAKKAELHTHRLEDGMMKMREVEEIEIPAGGTVTLKPGGLHIMLIGLHHQLTSGEEISLKLIFEDGEHQTIKVPVRSIDDAGEAEYHHTMH